MAAAVRNPDGTYVITVFNEYEEKKGYTLDIDGQSYDLHIPPQALQTIVIEPKQ
jgi:O-glycosyl hydrolase